MNRFAAKSAVEVLVLFIVFSVSWPQGASGYSQVAGGGQAAKPCSLVTKAEAESIVGASLVVRRDTDDECWYIESGFTNPAGPKNKQLYLNIWHSATPHGDDVRTTRANIADRQPTAVTRDLPGFADAALWSWMPGAGRLSAFKGGTIGVDVLVGGIAEGPALQHAKALAARALGGTAKTGFAYESAPAGNGPQVRKAAAEGDSPASYRDTWMGQTRTVRGTVSRLDMKSTGYPKWLTIYFKESPNGAFVVCSPYPDMFEETTGDLYRLVGKTLEVTGPIEGSMCTGKGGSIRVLESSGYRVEGLQAGTLTMAAGSLPVKNTNGPRLGLDICNAGQPAVDAVVAKQGRATMFHIPPAQCAHVFEDTAGPASVGFAFADARGQWGPASRADWRASPEPWGKGGGENMSIKRGNASVAVSAHMLFHPPPATCHTNANYETQYDPRHPYDARYATKVYTGTTTVCDSTEYDLNVVAYPETREVTFQKKCYACPPTSSPADQARSRAEVHQTTATMSKISPLAGGIMAGLIQRSQDQAINESLEGPPEFRRMSWDEMNAALAKVPRTSGRPPEMPQFLIIRGTVSRVEVSPPGASEHWVDVYFRESPEQASSSFETVYGAFDVCTSNPEILVDRFGPDFRTRMIGQVLEVEGEFQRAFCKGWKGSIRLTLAHQVRKAAAQ